LDDALAVGGSFSFEGGQVSGIVPNMIRDNQVSEMLNMTISPNGNISTRFGTESMSTSVAGTSGKVQGLFYFDTPNDEQLLVSSAGTLYRSTGATTFSTTGGTHVSASNSVEFAQLNDLAFYVDGSSDLFYTDGTGAFRQFGKVTGVVVDSAGTGYTTAPTVSFGTASGGSGATAIATVAGGSLLSVTVNSGGTGYTGVPTVSFSGGGGSGAAAFAKTVGSAVTEVVITSAGSQYVSAPSVSFTGGSGAGASATALVSAAIVTGVVVTSGGSGYTSAPTVTFTGGSGSGASATAFVHPPPAGLKLIKSFSNRLFAVGTGADRNTLYASDLLDPSVWKATNSIVVGGDDGEDIIAIQPYYNFQILVFKPTRIYIVLADPTATTAAGWTVQQVSDRIGCVAGRSVSFVNKDVFFLAADGIRTLSRSVADDFTTVGLPVSEPVKDIIARINRNFLASVNGVFHDNRYLLALPLDAATSPSHILVYNAIFNAFEGLWTIPATRMIQTNFSSGFTTNGVKLAIGDNSGRVGHSFDYKDEEEDADSDYQDHGAEITSRVTSKAYDFEDKLSQKFGSHFELEFFGSQATAAISMKRDTDSNSVLLDAAFDTSAGGSLTLPLTLPATLSANTVKRKADSLRSYQKWRNMRLVVESVSKRLSIRSMLLAANPDTIQLET